MSCFVSAAQLARSTEPRIAAYDSTEEGECDRNWSSPLAKLYNNTTVQGEDEFCVTTADMPSADTPCVLRNDKTKEIHVIEAIKAFRVGRDSSNDIQLQSPLASHVHFRIETVYISSEHDVLCYLTDTSTNGTLVQASRMKEALPIKTTHALLLNHGDRIVIPKICQFTFLQRMSHVMPFSDHFEKLSRCLSIYARGWTLSRRIVGSGASAVVLMASKENIQTACKIQPRKHHETLRGGRRLSYEVDILRQVSHPNIVRTDMVLLGPKDTYILSELVGGGDLFSYYCRAKLYGEERVADSERQIAWIIYQLLLALQHLHKRGIAHRDLKMENILVVEQHAYSRILLTDFGMAYQADAEKVDGQHAVRSDGSLTAVGTVPYQAPEILEAFRERLHVRQSAPLTTQFGAEVDYWSLGCLVHELLLGQPPFGLSPNDHEAEIYRKTITGEFGFDSLPVSYLSNLARSFIEGLLRKSPTDRLSVSQCLEHDWIVQYGNGFCRLYRKKVSPNWSPVLPIVKTFDSIPEIASTSELYSVVADNLARRKRVQAGVVSEKDCLPSDPNNGHFTRARLLTRTCKRRRMIDLAC